MLFNFKEKFLLGCVLHNFFFFYFYSTLIKELWKFCLDNNPEGLPFSGVFCYLLYVNLSLRLYGFYQP